GIDDIGIVRTQFAGGPLQWVLDRNSNSQYDAGDFSSFFGVDGDIPAPGDFNADHKDDPGIARGRASISFDARSTAVLQWVLDRNGNGLYDPGDSSSFFGDLAALPAAGKWTP